MGQRKRQSGRQGGGGAVLPTVFGPQGPKRWPRWLLLARCARTRAGNITDHPVGSCNFWRHHDRISCDRVRRVFEEKETPHLILDFMAATGQFEEPQNLKNLGSLFVRSPKSKKWLESVFPNLENLTSMVCSGMGSYAWLAFAFSLRS